MKKLSILWLLLGLLVAAPSIAQEAEEELPGTVGPAKIDLGNGLATLELPEGFRYLDKALTTAVLQQGGNEPSGGELGCLLMTDENEDFWVLIEYDAQGYVKDDEAGKIDPDEIFESYKLGTEAANERRKELGIPALHLTKWGEKPRYDAGLHHLVWALEAESDGSKVVNFNTRVLGREGVMSLNLVCGPEKLPEYKPVMDKILAATKYNEGKRYADYQEGDKVSEAGLIALVAGGAAAAKLGFFAKIGKFLMMLLIAGKKFIVLILVAIGAFFKRMFGGGAEEVTPLAAEPETDGESTDVT